MRESVLQSQVRLVGSQVLQTALAFAVLGASARRFDVPGFGALAHAMAWIAILVAVTDAGFGPRIVAALVRSPGEAAAAFHGAFKRRVWLAAAAAAAAVLATLTLSDRPLPVRLAEVAAIVVTAAALPLRTHESRIAAGARPGDLGTGAFIAQFLWVLLTAAAIARRSVVLAMLALAVREAAKSIAARAFAGRSGIAPPERPPAADPAAFPGGPLALAAAFSALYLQVDVFFVARIAGDGALGDYACAWRIFAPLVAAVGAAVVPFIRTFVRDDDPGRIPVVAVLGAVRALTLAVFPVAAAMIVCPDAGAVITGRTSPAIETAIRLFAVALAAIAVGAPASAALVAGDRARRWLGITAIALAVEVALDLSLIPRRGFAAGALATAITEIIVAFAALAASGAAGRAILRALSPAILLGGLVGTLGVLIQWPVEWRLAGVFGLAAAASAFGTFGPLGARARAFAEARPDSNSTFS